MPPSKLIVTKQVSQKGGFFIRGGLLLRGGDYSIHAYSTHRCVPSFQKDGQGRSSVAVHYAC